jgi:hypothetical protein
MNLFLCRYFLGKWYFSSTKLYKNVTFIWTHPCVGKMELKGLKKIWIISKAHEFMNFLKFLCLNRFLKGSITKIKQYIMTEHIICCVNKEWDVLLFTKILKLICLFITFRHIQQMIVVSLYWWKREPWSIIQCSWEETTDLPHVNWQTFSHSHIGASRIRTDAGWMWEVL